MTISNMMKADFLLTPLVENTEQFALLAAGGNKYLVGNEVKNISISSDDGDGTLWDRSYSLDLRKSNLVANNAVQNGLLFDSMDEAAANALSPPATEECDGSIESVNGTPPRMGAPTVGNALSVKGWLAVSGKDGITADSVFLTITNERGKTNYVKTRSTPRNDLRLHFNQPAMLDAGFTALVDVSSLNGKYALGIARTYKEILGVCQQFKLPLTISR